MAIVIGLIGMVVNAIVRGFVFKQFWLWFIIPVFHIQPISIPQSIGLMLIVGLVTTSGKDEDESSIGDMLLKTTIQGIGVSLFILLIGYVVKQFV